MPLHLAAMNGAGLEVVKALLEAHPEAAQEANEVRGGAAWETVGLWMCVSEGASECMRRLVYSNMHAHRVHGMRVRAGACVHIRVQVCMGERACVFVCLCVCLQTQRLHNVGAASCVLPACMLCKRQAATCVSHAHA